jgi:hypothetical protein
MPRAPSTTNSTQKALYWILTIPQHDFTPFLHPGVQYIRGQLELAASGFLHWQVLVVLKSQQRRSWVKTNYGTSCHAEPSRSEAADDYVWKEDTYVEGTRFEIGSRKLKRNNATDWDAVRDLACRGDLAALPSDVFVRHYRTVKAIAVDHCQPVALERKVHVYWGRTGTGKSRRAWEEAGLGAFPKDPRSKFWDGYRAHRNVVIDEFRGDIDISHILRWFDRFPVIVEIKGSASVLSAEEIWVTSNLDPRLWYPNLDPGTLDALLRRIEITHFE